MIFADFGVLIFKVAEPTFLFAGFRIVVDGIVAVRQVAFAGIVAAVGVNG